jgi:hypothetical protein
MNKKPFTHVSLRISNEDHTLLKTNASIKGMSINHYMIDLIRGDSVHNQGMPDMAELMRTVKKTNEMSRDLLAFSYVIFKLGSAILSYSYHADPSEEGIQNTIEFVNRKLKEAREQFK